MTSNPSGSTGTQGVEWPTFDTNLCYFIRQDRIPKLPPQTVIAKAKSLLDDEFSRCTSRIWPEVDQAAKTYYYSTTHGNDFGPLLKLLYWRGRQQTATYDLFRYLCRKGFDLANTGSVPTTSKKMPDTLRYLSCLLLCYAGPSRDHGRRDSRKLFTLQDRFVPLPLIWLAAMISRSNVNFTKVLDAISDAEYIGKMIRGATERLKAYFREREAIHNPEAVHVPELPRWFGFWLPEAVGIALSDASVEDRVKRFDRFKRIEKCYREWFGLGPVELSHSIDPMNGCKAAYELL